MKYYVTVNIQPDKAYRFSIQAIPAEVRSALWTKWLPGFSWNTVSIPLTLESPLCSSNTLQNRVSSFALLIPQRKVHTIRPASTRRCLANERLR